ncbi:hypothetical protein [Apilactobacillus micheneri]|uniref:hypothetical protein n=1 Tax=Apilactobacillus micheneri TaxID=1899430 RepID=UPI00112A145F|nr:hypothetical protein [Apilactobacillus micheneri]TPR39131.1 hypothetical protein DY119_05570 [Apilactobacillus micheneri]
MFNLPELTILFKGANGGDWLQACATIFALIVSQLCTIYFINKQINADKKNAIDSEIYLEKYKALTVISNEILKVRKNMIDSSWILLSLYGEYNYMISNNKKSTSKNDKYKEIENNIKKIEELYSDNFDILNKIMLEIDMGDIDFSKTLLKLIEELFDKNEWLRAYFLHVRVQNGKENYVESKNVSYSTHNIIKHQVIQTTPNKGIISAISLEIKKLKENNKRI